MGAVWYVPVVQNKAEIILDVENHLDTLLGFCLAHQDTRWDA